MPRGGHIRALRLWKDGRRRQGKGNVGLFDFLDGLEGYEGQAQPATRMNKRHAMLIAPVADEIAGARVLDIAAHDGRWSYAFAAAGAAEVSAVEPRAALRARYDEFPGGDFKDRVTFRHLDLFEAMEADVAAGQTWDVIALFGILYHIMDHVRVMRLVHALKPRLVIVDSEFMLRPNPMIQLATERTDKDLNAYPAFPGQTRAVIGTPSKKAMEAIAASFDFTTEWIDAEALFGDDRVGVQDYFREGLRRRAACRLRPEG